MDATTPRPDRTGFVGEDDHRMYYEYFGDAERETICLLNGVVMSTETWYSLLSRIRPDFDVLLCDFPGQGKVKGEGNPYSIPRTADRLAEILDDAGLAKIHLMGVSYGGFVALDFARLHQDRLHTLTVSGCLVTDEKLFRMFEDVCLGFHRGGEALFDLYTHFFYERIFGETFVRKHADLLGTMRQRFKDRYQADTHILTHLGEAQQAFMNALAENTPGYRAIRTPTLVMAGNQDMSIPVWVQKKMIGILPESRFVGIEDSGHVVFMEQPRAFFEHLKAFARARVVAYQEPRAPTDG